MTDRYWSHQVNPSTGCQLEHFRRYLEAWSDDRCDVDGLIASEYGQRLGYLQDLAYRWRDPMDPELLEWYEAQGIKKEMFETEHYYTRWTLLRPADMEKGRRYPLVFVNHGGGNSIESEEFSTGFNVMVNREQFLAVYLQNTNTDNLLRVRELLIRTYPVDTERIYVTGFSQGGGKTSDCAFRAPELFAAHAPCGNDIFRYVDRWSVPYTQQEIDNLKKTFLPFMQVVGCNEHSHILPLNHWERAEARTERIEGDIHDFPPKNGETDPTRPSDPSHPGGHIEPPQGAHPGVWMLRQLNNRLELLDIDPRDIETCLNYRSNREDELHHVLGFYGDREQIRTFYGYKHYIIDIWNRHGVNAFRYVAVENSPHWPEIMMGELVWEFFKQFRRDRNTGRVFVDPYVPSGK